MDPYDVRIVVTVPCTTCSGKGRVPGGLYRDQGEVMNCLACGGWQRTREERSLSELYDLLHGNLPRSQEGT